MHGAQASTRHPGETLVYYVCPTLMNKPQDKAAWPGHVRASLREDALTAELSEFLDDYALGYDRAARLPELDRYLNGKAAGLARVSHLESRAFLGSRCTITAAVR
jgi:hypothetical protein